LVIALVVFAACGSTLPWHDAPPPDEVNLSFTIHNNLLFLPSAKINGHTGRFFFGSATPRTVVLTIVALITVDLLFTSVFYYLGW